MSAARRFTLTDALITQFDGLLQTLGSDASRHPSQPSPARRFAESATRDGRQTAAESLRVDHLDQVVNVALLRGRALSAHNGPERERLFGVAAQGFDRVLWTQARLTEVQGSTSHLVPLAYATALVSGAVAQGAGQHHGQQISAAHCRATEKRLRDQLERLSTTDQRSRALVKALADQQGQGAYVASSSRSWHRWPLRLGAGLASTVTARLVRHF
ncbi:hypothetical protein [Carnimonas bestiolae]|uniref:hypothetical protein n=1 Tax=Carnimonas bestiolae TaxID=3402172 RepID=UPI003EDCAB35